MIEQIILGTIQGITEWLPISSEALIIFIQNTFFNSEATIETLLRGALFLHLGTFLAALVYFRKEVLKLIKTLISFKSSSPEEKNILIFLIISTFISGIIGLGFYFLISKSNFTLNSLLINLIIGALLLITAYLQLKTKKENGFKKEGDATLKDGIILGVVQGFAIFPGLSRSGLTISSLLLRKYNDTSALKLSFLMSLPIVLAGNLILNFKELIFISENIIGLIFSFIFGILTIEALLKITKKVNFGYFVLFFAFLVIISAFI